MNDQRVEFANEVHHYFGMKIAHSLFTETRETLCIVYTQKMRHGINSNCSLQESHKTPGRLCSRICGLGEVVGVSGNHDVFVEVSESHGKWVEVVVLALWFRQPCTENHFRAWKQLPLRGHEVRAVFFGFRQ